MTTTPGPQIVPRAAIRAHLLDLLFFLYGGHNLPPAQHQRAKEGIRDLAATTPEMTDVANLAQQPGQQSLAAIGARAPQIAAMMDTFFAGYGVQWNGQNSYIFNDKQWDEWRLVPEDINSSRQYSTSPQLQVDKLLSNLLKLLNHFS